MTQIRQVEGTVLTIRCRTCGEHYPHFEFSGDSDTLTDGLGSATSCEKKELVIAETTAAEDNFCTSGIVEFEQRLARDLSRSDLHVIRLLRVERAPTVGPTSSLREFMKHYVPNTLVFSCPCCDGGEAVKIEELTPSDFQFLGGRITFVGRLGF